MSESGPPSGAEACGTFVAALRLLKLYDVGNVAWEEPLEELAALVRRAVDATGSARVQVEEGVVYYNREPVRAGRRGFTTLQDLTKALGQLGLAELAFTGGMNFQELRAFFRIVQSHQGESYDVRRLQEEVGRSMFGRRVELNVPGEASGTAQNQKVELNEETYFPLAYARTLILVREYLTQYSDDELNRYYMGKLQRALQELSKLMPKHWRQVLTLSLLKGADTYRYAHLTNTGLLSMVVGYHLGVGKVRLSDLGLCGLLHGLGEVQAPQSELRGQAYAGIESILVGRKLTARTLATALVAFQRDMDGFEEGTGASVPLHPYSMVVRVCATFDALTTDREGAPAVGPVAALRNLVASPESYDAKVVGVLAILLGIRPGDLGVDTEGLDQRQRFLWEEALPDLELQLEREGKERVTFGRDRSAQHLAKGFAPTKRVSRLEALGRVRVKGMEEAVPQAMPPQSVKTSRVPRAELLRRLAAEDDDGAVVVEEGDGKLIPRVWLCGKRIRPLPLEGEQLTVGRRPDCDLVVPVPTVSRVQGVLQRDGGSWRYVHKSGSNVSLLNGKEVKEATLVVGDVLQFGDLRVVLKEVLLWVCAQHQIPEGLEANGRAEIGRDPKMEVVVPNEQVSRRHGVFRTTRREVTYEDLGSFNGSFVNGVQVEKEQPVDLKAGDVLGLGTFKLKLRSNAQMRQRLLKGSRKAERPGAGSAEASDEGEVAPGS